LIELGEKQHQVYAANEPFSHIVIDDFFDSKALVEVLAEVDTVDRSKRYAKFLDRETDHNKFAFFPDVVGPNTARLAQCLNSGPFLAYLEKLTGIPNLIADPSYFGGGVHWIENGGYLEVQSGAAHQSAALFKQGLERRVQRGPGIVGSPDHDEAQGGCSSVQSDGDIFHGERGAARSPDTVAHAPQRRAAIAGTLLLHEYLGTGSPGSYHHVLHFPKTQSKSQGIEDCAWIHSRSHSTDLSQDLQSDQASDQG
jgi:hypothetical protein